MVFVPVFLFMPVYLYVYASVKNPGANFSFEKITRDVGKLMKNSTAQNYIRLFLALVVIRWFLQDIRNKRGLMSMITHWFSSGFRIYLFFFLIHHE